MLLVLEDLQQILKLGLEEIDVWLMCQCNQIHRAMQIDERHWKPTVDDN